MPANSTLGGKKPHLIIRPPKKWVPLDFHEIWKYRELLYSFVSRDVKVRYKQTALGFLWVIIQPLFMMVIFTLFFVGFAKIPSDGVPYPLFSYAALLPWTLFAEGLSRSTTSMVSNAGIITKVYFLRLVMPISGILSSSSSSVICYTSRDGSVLRGWRHAIEIGISPTR
jgi:lipopolysaccharide transport system permease protein